jgi:hypothetical protein
VTAAARSPWRGRRWRDSAAVVAGLDLDLGARTRLGVAYKGELAPDAREHAVVAALSVMF